MWLNKLVKPISSKLFKSRLHFGLVLMVLSSVFQACASSHVEAQKSPGADLWMYHTYAWRAQGSTADQIETAQKAKERTDYALAKEGMIPVPYSGNPDVWVLQDTTPLGIALEFRDAHTGATFWKDQSRFKSESKTPDSNTIDSAVDALVHRYVADQEWKNSSWWFSSGMSKG